MAGYHRGGVSPANRKQSQTGQRADYSGCRSRITREVGRALRFKDQFGFAFPLTSVAPNDLTHANK
jgi:hypothetical protein